MTTDSQDRVPTIYFGYGSNMWLDQMRRRCPGSKHIGIGILHDWYWFICTRGYANVIENDDDLVYGSMFILTEEDERSLDRYEGVPHSYVKKILPVTYLGTEEIGEVVDGKRIVQTLVYVDVERTDPGPPKVEYVWRMNQAIVDGIKQGIPESYINKYLRPAIPQGELFN
ncbi:hypothetical protein AX16_001592 [Volvariella volvacea WC 439]|nr:hypothetical protein AX16_001592 [Volvariella volvacea WC 439]